MNKKIILVVPLILVLAGAGYTFTKKKPVVHMKVTGTIYLLPESFLDNLSDGHYAKFSVALVLAPGQSDGASAAADANSGSASDGTTLGTLPEEALVRAIITDVVTGETSAQLISAKGREATEKQILKEITQQTDVKVTSVLFPDLAIQ